LRRTPYGQRTADGLLANPLRFTHNPPVAEGVPRLFGRSRFNAFRGEFMVAVRLRIFHLGLMLATALVVSILATAGQAYTPEQQQACSGDAFRLCGPEIPDVDRVTACMIRQRSQLSPGCKALFQEPAPALTPVATHRPLVIRPRKVAKAKGRRRSN
jgi:hypothetical protein